MAKTPDRTRPRTSRTEEVPAKTDPAVAGPPRARQVIAVGKLARALGKEIEGEVRFDSSAKGLYAHDASNFRQVPIGVVVPKTPEDVVATHRICREYGAPILNRGGGTSLSGETVNYAVVIDHSKHLTRIGAVDAEERHVTVEPGVINEELNRHTGAWNLVFGPDPSTHSRCVLGGNIGNNSCGTHSVQSQLYGPGPRTSDNVEALEIVTYGGDRFWVGVDEEEGLESIIAAGGPKGEIYAKLRDLRDRYADAIRAGFPSMAEMPRRVSGYNLDELLPENGFNVARALVGTESTCATVLQAQVKLTPALLQRTLVVVEYEQIAAAAEDANICAHQFRPIGLEALDQQLIEDQKLQHMNLASLEQLPRQGGAAWLLVEFGADTKEQAHAQAHRFRDWLTGERGYAADRITTSDEDEETAKNLWKVRESGLGATAFPPDGDHWPGWEDSAVPPARLGEYVTALRGLLDKHGLRAAMYGHFAQGCIHSRISFDLLSAEGMADYRAFMEEAADLVSSFGGSLSGEHGDGQQRGELLERQYGSELIQAMREFKQIWDPEAKMNPGKVVDAYRLDEDLRLGPDFNPPRPEVKFAYAEDDGDFAHAGLRCVGIGACRVPDASQGQTMCPSYQVTREEKHTTRGRARLLHEMLRGETVEDGWQSKEVYDALDLCLACKGCTNDCPVNVDMPTYKAEFLHHHFKSARRWRPRYAYAFGFIDQASRLASRLPEAANLATHAPLLGRIAKLVAGIDRRRPLPTFAPMTLQRWFRQRGGTANPGGRPVVLFPDTFNNYFDTDVGVACVEAIEAAGWSVVMPEQHVCCGRPLYDYGFLDAAERYLHNVLDTLRPHLRADTPVVGMEPSCLAVFKDELTKLLPHDNDARRLAANALHFAEFFDTYGITPPRPAGTGAAPKDQDTASDTTGAGDALLWGHCHQLATGGTEADRKLLDKLGLRTENLTGGCCGLAGSWGFEQGKYGISMDCGEQALLPAVRDAAPGTTVVANGFSCKTQLAAAGVGSEPVHLAELVKRAYQGTSGAAEPTRKPAPAWPRRAARLAAPAAVAAGAAFAAGRALRVARGR